MPYGSRPLYTLAGSHSPAGYHSRDGSQSPAVRMDNLLGCPQTITTDQGRQFESQLFHSLAIMCGINLSHAKAFHLAANGLVERMLRSRQAAIMWQAQER
jgi:transposase InsO family protein